MVTAIRQIIMWMGLVLLLIIGLDYLYASGVLSGAVQWIAGAFGFEFEWKGLTEMSPMLVGSLGLAGVLLPAAAFLMALAERAVSRGIVAKAQDGSEINLKPEAIERSVNRDIRENVEEVTRVISTARQGKRAPKLRVVVTVREKANVPEVREAVLNEAQKTLEETLGVSDTSQIKVVIGSISRRSGSSPTPKAGKTKSKSRRSKSETPEKTSAAS